MYLVLSAFTSSPGICSDRKNKLECNRNCHCCESQKIQSNVFELLKQHLAHCQFHSNKTCKWLFKNGCKFKSSVSTAVDFLNFFQVGDK